MSTSLTVAPADDRELVLARLLDASPEKVFRCWTEPELIKRWFTPPPFETVHAEVDLRPGGSVLMVMRGPDGAEAPNPGVYLEVVPNARLVFTDAFTQAWLPSTNPFMVATLTFDPEGLNQTRYVARVRHWTAEAKAQHEAMGFQQGWGTATDQLEAVARSL
jgi:uncharacterized protein YndB with AHSA1/START domain